MPHSLSLNLSSHNNSRSTGNNHVAARLSLRLGNASRATINVAGRQHGIIGRPLAAVTDYLAGGARPIFLSHALLVYLLPGEQASCLFLHRLEACAPELRLIARASSPRRPGQDARAPRTFCGLGEACGWAGRAGLKPAPTPCPPKLCWPKSHHTPPPAPGRCVARKSVPGPAAGPGGPDAG